MSKFLHDDDDDAKPTTIPRRFLKKNSLVKNVKMHSNLQPFHQEQVTGPFHYFPFQQMLPLAKFLGFPRIVR